MVALIFLVAALVCFIIAALGVPTNRYNLVAAGLACMVAAQLAPKVA